MNMWNVLRVIYNLKKILNNLCLSTTMKKNKIMGFDLVLHPPGTEAHVPWHIGKMVKLPGTFQSKIIKIE